MMRQATILGQTVVIVGLAASLVAASYSLRPRPVPDESKRAVSVEQQMSKLQAELLTQHDNVIVDTAMARQKGYDVEGIVQRLARVGERPGLSYRVYVLSDSDPKVVALPDGRLYISMGLIDSLAWRQAPEDELAFVIAHELAHVNAQHLFKTFNQFRGLGVLGALQTAGNVAGVVRGVKSGNIPAAQNIQMVDTSVSVREFITKYHETGYGLGDEFEADQFALRYLMRADFDPEAALRMLEEWQRFDRRSELLRIHPYPPRRVKPLKGFLEDARSNPALVGETAAQP